MHRSKAIKPTHLLPPSSSTIPILTPRKGGGGRGGGGGSKGSGGKMSSKAGKIAGMAIAATMAAVVFVFLFYW
jgi:hypothetical protein